MRSPSSSARPSGLRSDRRSPDQAQRLWPSPELWRSPIRPVYGDGLASGPSLRLCRQPEPCLRPQSLVSLVPHPFPWRTAPTSLKVGGFNPPDEGRPHIVQQPSSSRRRSAPPRRPRKGWPQPRRRTDRAFWFDPGSQDRWREGSRPDARGRSRARDRSRRSRSLRSSGRRWTAPSSTRSVHRRQRSPSRRGRRRTPLGPCAFPPSTGATCSRSPGAPRPPPTSPRRPRPIPVADAHHAHECLEVQGRMAPLPTGGTQRTPALLGRVHELKEVAELAHVSPPIDSAMSRIVSRGRSELISNQVPSSSKATFSVRNPSPRYSSTEIDTAPRDEPPVLTSRPLCEGGPLPDGEPVPTSRIEGPRMTDPSRRVVRRDETAGWASAVRKRAREPHAEPDDGRGFVPPDLSGTASRALDRMAGREW